MKRKIEVTMTHLFLSALLIFLATSTFAQITDPIELITKDGRTIIIKPNGTWEFKKVMPQSSPTTIVNSSKSIETDDSLPTNFAGQDAKNLIARLRELKKRLVKTEFETTPQYEKRVAEEKQKPILENLTINDTFSIVMSGVRANYNADTEKMSFFLPVEKNREFKLVRESEPFLDIYKDKKNAADLSYINLYSIQEKVEGSYYGYSLGIFFDDLNSLPLGNYDQGFSVEVSLSVEEAKRLKNTTKAVAIVKLEEPYVGTTLNRQLQVHLLDIYFFDPQTGKILAKMSESKK